MLDNGGGQIAYPVEAMAITLQVYVDEKTFI
jgi:hypothetical protein